MTDKTMKIGIIGVGHLISYLVPGMLRGEHKSDFLLSPRNHKTALALAQNHNLEIAGSNHALVEACDVIILSVRPGQVKNAIEGLPWRSGQLIISLCAGVSIGEISTHTKGVRITRALPVTAAKSGESPTAIYPQCDFTRTLLGPCGPTVVLEDENQFEAATMFGAYYGWIQYLIGEMAEWAQSNNLSPEAARLLACQMTRAAATTVRDTPEKPIEALVDELCLPGSITGLGLHSLKQEDAFRAWHQAGDDVLQNLKGKTQLR